MEFLKEFKKNSLKYANLFFGRIPVTIHKYLLVFWRKLISNFKHEYEIQDRTIEVAQLMGYFAIATHSQCAQIKSTKFKSL